VTSGDWGHRIGKNLAYAFVHPKHAAKGAGLTADLIGQIVPVTVTDRCLYDPKNELVKG
jgi:dimethylglycine dehydrogenase